MKTMDNQILPTKYKGLLTNTILNLARMARKLDRTRQYFPIKIISDETPITVREYDGEVLAYCNHAGAQLEDVVSDWTDNPTLVKANVCDKCRKVQNDDGNWL